MYYYHVFQYKDFTTDPVNFPTHEMKGFIEELHSNGQRYGNLTSLTAQLIIGESEQPAALILCNSAVVIVDPGISNIQGYQPYQDGLEMDIFIKVASETYKPTSEATVTGGTISL